MCKCIRKRIQIFNRSEKDFQEHSQVMGEAGPVMQWCCFKTHYSGSVSNSNNCISSSSPKINYSEIQTQSIELITEAQHYRTSFIVFPNCEISPRRPLYIHYR